MSEQLGATPTSSACLDAGAYKIVIRRDSSLQVHRLLLSGNIQEASSFRVVEFKLIPDYQQLAFVVSFYRNIPDEMKI